MFLSAEAIRTEVAEGRLVIDPFDERLLKPSSYVLRLGTTQRVWQQAHRSLSIWPTDTASEFVTGAQESDEITLPPNRFVLASSLERIAMPDRLVGFLCGLSHVGRYGIAVHQGSNLVSPGFGASRPSVLTFELSSTNSNTLVAAVGMPLCHLVIAAVEPPATFDRLLSISAFDGDQEAGGPLLIDEFGWLRTS